MKKRRILWLTQVVPKVVARHLGRKTGGTGFWIHSLIDVLARREDVELGVVCQVPSGKSQALYLDNVQYYCLGMPKFFCVFPSFDSLMMQRLLRGASQAIEEFKPDILHIHGTECCYGLLKTLGMVKTIPAVLSIQGLWGPYIPYAWGNKSFWDVLKLQRFSDLRKGLQPLWVRRIFKKKAKIEKRILPALDGILGRTSWDRSHAWELAPEVPYYHVDELMRPEFFEAEWALDGCRRKQVFSSCISLRKGGQVFVEAMGILKREYPDLQVRFAGGKSGAEGRYLQRLASDVGLDGAIDFLGWIPAERLVEECQAANVYANSSYIENGCNALQEAMLLGCPCVAPFAGGMSTTLAHRQTGLMFPPGDSAMLADRCRELFENDELAVSLGQAARKRARQRHDPDVIVHSLLSAYQAVIEKNHPGK